MSGLGRRIEYELDRRAAQNERASVVGPDAADLRTAYVGGPLAAGGYPHLAQPHIPVGLHGVEKHIAAPFGYGQDEDMYAGPTSFDHVPHIARPVPLGGIDDYHMASDPRLTKDRTLKEKYEACAINHRVGYDRYGRLDYATQAPAPGFHYPVCGAPGFGGFQPPSAHTQDSGNQGFGPTPSYVHRQYAAAPRDFGFGLN